MSGFEIEAGGNRGKRSSGSCSIEGRWGYNLKRGMHGNGKGILISPGISYQNISKVNVEAKMILGRSDHALRYKCGNKLELGGRKDFLSEVL